VFHGVFHRRPFRGVISGHNDTRILLITKKLVVANIQVLIRGIKCPKLLSRIHIRHLSARDFAAAAHPPIMRPTLCHVGHIWPHWARENALWGAPLCHTLCQHLTSWHTLCQYNAHHGITIVPHHHTGTIAPHHAASWHHTGHHSRHTIAAHRTQQGVSCPTVRHTIDHCQAHQRTLPASHPCTNESINFTRNLLISLMFAN
jgi:hypothetical protein